MTTINLIIAILLWGVMLSNILTAAVMQITLLVLQTKKGDMDVDLKARYRVGITVHLAWAMFAYMILFIAK